MNRLLLTLTAIAFTIGAGAQVSVQTQQTIVTANPQAVKQAPARKAAPAKIEANQRWVGLYSSDALGENGMGIPEVAGNNRAAALLDNSILSSAYGKKVVAIRFGLCETLDSSRVFIAPIRQAEFADEEDSVLADLVSVKVPSTVLGWNTITLDNPITLTPEMGDLLVGFDYVQKNTPMSNYYTGDCYPLSMVQEGPQNQPLMVWCELPAEYGGTGRGWYRFGAGNNNLSVQMLVEGSFAEYAVTPHDFDQVAASANDKASVPVTFFNFSKEAVSSLDYVVTVDGQTGEEQHIDISPAIATGSSGTFYASVATGDKDATLAVSIEVTKVNGNANEADDKVCEGKVAVATTAFARNIVIEEFTTEHCPNCPLVADYLHTALENANPNRVYAVCHHSAFYSDWLTRACDTQLTWLFNDNGSTYAPAMMFNRQPDWDAAYNDGQKDNVMIPYSPSHILSIIDEHLASLANARLTMDVQPNDTGVTVTVNGLCNNAYDQTSSLLTLYMTEDSVKAQRQSDNRSDAPDEYWHMHVLRYDNGTWGDSVKWQDNTFTATYGIRVDNAWNKKNLKFVAFLNKHNADNRLDNRIENSIGMDYPVAAGISSVSTGDGTESVSWRYNVAGQRISGTQRGLNIVRLANGKTIKVMVK